MTSTRVVLVSTLTRNVTRQDTFDTPLCFGFILNDRVFRFWSMTKWASRPPFTIFLMFQTQLWHLHFKAQRVFGLCQHIRIKSVAETANQSRPRSRPECWETPLMSLVQIYGWVPWEDSEDVPGQQTKKTTTTTMPVKYSIHLFTVLIQSTKPEEEREDTGWQSPVSVAVSINTDRLSKSHQIKRHLTENYSLKKMNPMIPLFTYFVLKMGSYIQKR